jgi:hypothetical protein
MLAEVLTKTEATKDGSMWWWILPLAPDVPERLAACASVTFSGITAIEFNGVCTRLAHAPMGSIPAMVPALADGESALGLAAVERDRGDTGGNFAGHGRREVHSSNRKPTGIKLIDRDRGTHQAASAKWRPTATTAF